MSKRFHLQIPKENIRSEKYEKTGGGETFQRLNHFEHGTKLLSQTLRLAQVELTKKDSSFTEELFLQIETPPELSVKQEKFKIEKLGIDIISYSKENKSIGTAKMKKSNLNVLTERISQYAGTEEHVGKSYFTVIEDISVISSEHKIKTVIDYESENKISIVINLYNALTRKERLAINNFIVEELKEKAEDAQIRNFSNGITSIACVIKEKDIPKLADEFSTIKEIKKNYLTFITTSTPVESMPNPLVVNEPESDSIICIIDSGISDANGIFTNIVVDRLHFLPPKSIKTDNIHGTFVASRCVFGDEIDSCLGSHSLTPYCKLVDISVFGIDSHGQDVYPDEFHLRSVIEDIVILFNDRIKVYNLSLGSSVPINDFEFSELAKLLDFLSKEYKVLFVISAGNINSLLGAFPNDHFSHGDSRLGCPAESILSVTVGSIARFVNASSLSQLGEISPFSRIGPGADLGVKPELVIHGGNLISPYSFSPRIATYGISQDGRNLSVDNGTSHSAPLISQFAQKLFDLYPDSDPNLVKALLYHFAEKRGIHEEIVQDQINYVGFGEPNIENAIEAHEYNSAYIYEGQLDQENYQYISFHIPDSLAEANRDSKLKVKITIVYDPPVNPDNEAEYSMARISAQLIKPTTGGMRPINVSGDDKYILPWNPTIQFEKEFSRSYLSGVWDLRLRLFCRGKLPEDYMQDYAVVIEISDENGSTDVYSDILTQFVNLYKQIKINLAA